MRILALALLTACWASPAPPPSEPIANKSALAEAEPGAAHSVWRGLYQCAQGETAVQLTLDIVGDQVSAIFDFGPFPGNKGVPPGSYRLRGTARERGETFEIELEPDKWISQPEGYMMVGLIAESDASRRELRGKITNDACTWFHVTRK